MNCDLSPIIGPQSDFVSNVHFDQRTQFAQEGVSLQTDQNITSEATTARAVSAKVHLVQEPKCKESLKEGLLKTFERACNFAAFDRHFSPRSTGICYATALCLAVQWGVLRANMKQRDSNCRFDVVDFRTTDCYFPA